MKSVIRNTFVFLTPKERLTYVMFLIGRCLASGLDLLGVAALGYLATSIALFLTQGSDYKRSFNMFGFQLPAANMKILPIALGIVLFIFVFKAVVSLFLTYKMTKQAAIIEARAAKKIVRNVLGSGLERMRSISREELLYTTSNGASGAVSQVLSNIATVASEAFLFIGLLVTFFLIDPVSTLFTIVYFGLLALSIQKFVGSKMEGSSRSIGLSMMAANSALNDIASTFRELSVAGGKERYFDSFATNRYSAASQSGKQLYLASLPRYIVETAVLVGILIFGGLKLLTSDLESSVTTISIFFTGSMRMMAAMLPWQAALVSLRQLIPQAKMAQEAMFDESSGVKISDGVTPTSPATVEVRDLCYAYQGSDNQALDGVTFRVDAGQQVAFVGASGSGKSTLADLIMGLLDLQRGSIFVDGAEPTHVLQLRPGYLGYVPQRPGAVSGTILQNITLGLAEEEVDRARVLQVIRDVRLSTMIESLPLGVDTDLGSHSDALSGGQLQRVGLARALYTQPKLLILDEATSALDAETEAIIGETIEKLRGVVTVIQVAHRLHTVKNADKVLYFDRGKLVDSGSFSEIKTRNSSIARAIELMHLKE
jgi:ABC-type multidrug transport system fused ATPase/permease subunit